MRTSGAAQVVIALSLVVLTLGPFVVGPMVQGSGVVAEEGHLVSTDRVQRPSAFELSDHESPVAERRSVEAVDSEVQVVAQLHEDVDLPRRVEQRYSEVYTREGARQLRGTVRLSEVRSLSNQPGVGAVRIEGVPRIDDQRVAPGVSRIGADRLHERGITGEGVTVGVIDSGFQLSHPQIAGHVTAYRSFDGAQASPHGTAVASVVADTAPDANLHLAAVGPTTSRAEYRQAVEWLKASGVDVIVDAGSYFGKERDAGSGIEEVASKASSDVVFVTSAGNYAQRHWVGDVSNGSSQVQFAPGETKNYLGDDDRVSGNVGITLRWSGTADYDLYLLREMPTGDIVVARSETYQSGDGVSTERISRQLPEGRYYVTIQPNGSVSESTELELFASHELSHRTPEGSLTAPATAPKVITVGAYANDSVESFSSRGPGSDGDHGVDFVAPDTLRVESVQTAGGTSFAAPYVAGTAALIKSDDESLSPDDIESILAMGATDVGPEGVDSASGHGLIDATRAYQVSRSTTLPDRVDRSPYVEADAEESGTNETAEVDERRTDATRTIKRAIENDPRVVEDPLVAWGGVEADEED